MGLIADKHRFTLALVVVLSGLSVIPFTALPGEYFGWESYSGAYDLIFASGFEEGSPPWDGVVPPTKFGFEPAGDESSYARRFRLDTALLRKVDHHPVELMVGFSADLERLFSVEYRRIDGRLEVRLRALSDGEELSLGDWIELSRPAQPLVVEWNRALQETGDGHLYLSEGEHLRAWLTGLSNYRHNLDRIGLLNVHLRPAVLPLAN